MRGLEEEEEEEEEEEGECKLLHYCTLSILAVPIPYTVSSAVSPKFPCLLSAVNLLGTASDSLVYCLPLSLCFILLLVLNAPPPLFAPLSLL